MHCWIFFAIQIGLVLLGLENAAFSQIPMASLEKSLLKGATRGLVQRATVGFAWSPSLGDNGIDVTETNIGFTSMLPLPIPFLKERTKMTLLSLTPNFKYTNVQWHGSRVVPESLYSAGVGVGLISIIDERRRFIATAMPSYAADGKAKRRNINCPVMLALNWATSKTWSFTVGVIYLDRSDIPVLPIGGAIYTPNEDCRLELMMPTVKLAKRARWVPNDELYPNWWSLGVGFSGGSWAFLSVAEQDDFAMLREYAVKCGWEQTRTICKWTAEIEYLFGREIRFAEKTQETLKLGDSLALRWTVSF